MLITSGLIPRELQYKNSVSQFSDKERGPGLESNRLATGWHHCGTLHSSDNSGCTRCTATSASILQRYGREDTFFMRFWLCKTKIIIQW